MSTQRHDFIPSASMFDVAGCEHFCRHCGRTSEAEIHQQRNQGATTIKCSRQPFPCCYADAGQCGHDRATSADSPKVCTCLCHQRQGTLSHTEADAFEAEIRRLEADPVTDKHALRLFMQSPMPCGHAVGNLLTCPDPPFGCVICIAAATVNDELREAVRQKEARVEQLERRVHAFQEGYKDQSFNVTALEIQLMDLRAHGVDKITERNNASLRAKLHAACIERNEARASLAEKEQEIEAANRSIARMQGHLIAQQQEIERLKGYSTEEAKERRLMRVAAIDTEEEKEC